MRIELNDAQVLVATDQLTDDCWGDRVLTAQSELKISEIQAEAAERIEQAEADAETRVTTIEQQSEQRIEELTGELAGERKAHSEKLTATKQKLDLLVGKYLK